MSMTDTRSSRQTFGNLTTEPVGYYTERSSKSISSTSSSSSDGTSSSKTLKKWLLILLGGTLIFLLFSVIYQGIQNMFLASDVQNSKPLSGLVNVDEFIASHPPNRIGLWKQCNDGSGCGELQVWCDVDEITQRLQSAGLLALATPEQAAEFVDQEARLCPLFVASRTTSILAIFAGVVAAIGLFLGLRRNSRAAFITTVAGAFLMTVLTAATLGLLVTIKNVLDYLSILGSRYSAQGSNTSNPFVDTVYSYSPGFWLVVAAFILAVLLLPLAFIVAHYARNYRIARNKYGSEYGSSFGSVDIGPSLSNKGSKEPIKNNSSYIVRESVQNVTYNNPNSVNYEMPPVTQPSMSHDPSRRFVRFDGSKPAQGTTINTTTVTTVKTTTERAPSPTGSVRSFVPSIKDGN